VQRTVIVAATGALSVALLLGVTGCSPGFSGDDGAQGGGAPATSPVSQPGRHSGLPEPCGTPDQDRLRDLLPGAGSEALKGASRVTYDTGRRAACDWASESEGTVYELSVDFLRTLSYDPEISDNDRAALDFAARADLAAILPEEDTREDDGDGDGDGDEEPDAGTGPDRDRDRDENGDGDGASTTPDGESGTGTGTGTDAEAGAGLDGVTRPAGEYAPRMLSGIGHAAYVDDRLAADGTRRQISLVFHTSNVIVAIDYSETVEESGQGLGSAILQELVRALARQVAGRFDD
jgi:hypothetical protein